jgi:hypothetical protein
MCGGLEDLPMAIWSKKKIYRWPSDPTKKIYTSINQLKKKKPLRGNTSEIQPVPIMCEGLEDLPLAI